MAGIEHHNARIGKIAAEGLRTGRDEEQILLAPGREEAWPVFPEEGLIKRIALDIPLVVEFQIDLVEAYRALFAETIAYAYGLGMMIQVSSNGSRLHQPRMIDLLTRYRPYRITLSLYGATEDSYDAMTRSRGAFRRFIRGLDAARDAGLSMRINIIVSNRNAHQRDAMQALASRYGIPAFEYTSITPTYHGTGEVLPSQAREVKRTHTPYTGDARTDL